MRKLIIVCVLLSLALSLAPFADSAHVESSSRSVEDMVAATRRLAGLAEAAGAVVDPEAVESLVKDVEGLGYDLAMSGKDRYALEQQLEECQSAAASMVTTTAATETSEEGRFSLGDQLNITERRVATLEEELRVARSANVVANDKIRVAEEERHRAEKTLFDCEGTLIDAEARITRLETEMKHQPEFTTKVTETMEPARQSEEMTEFEETVSRLDERLRNALRWGNNLQARLTQVLAALALSEDALEMERAGDKNPFFGEGRTTYSLEIFPAQPSSRHRHRRPPVRRRPFPLPPFDFSGQNPDHNMEGMNAEDLKQ